MIKYLIVTAELVSCFKRTVFRMFAMIIVLGFGIVVKSFLGSLKQVIIAISVCYFIIATNEAILRINTKDDETNRRIWLIARISLAVVDFIIYYWICTSLVKTQRILFLRKNFAKLNVYRHLTSIITYATIFGTLFMILSTIPYFFVTCIANWHEFWVSLFVFVS